MTDRGTDTAEFGGPVQWLRRVLRRSWNDFRSVYYANTFIWRVFKSAALVFLGLFCWTGANLLLSYRPDWEFLWYLMAYGFLLLFWGPFTHFVVVPLVIRLRRRGGGPVARVLSRHGSKANLTIFVLLVVLLGTYPVGPMVFEFQLPTDGGSGSDVNPALQCTRSPDEVHCHLSDSRGVDRLVVTTGGRTVTEVDDAPYAFDVRIDELESVRGQRQFTVELQDADGRTVRRYVRLVETIPGAEDDATRTVDVTTVDRIALTVGSETHSTERHAHHPPGTRRKLDSVVRQHQPHTGAHRRLVNAFENVPVPHALIVATESS